MPNDLGGYVRVEKKPQEWKPLTASERFWRLASFFASLAPKIRGRQKNNPPRKREHAYVWLLGRFCKVHKSHLIRLAKISQLRRDMPEDLSVNAVVQRRLKGLDPWGRKLAA